MKGTKSCLLLVSLIKIQMLSALKWINKVKEMHLETYLALEGESLLEGLQEKLF